MFLNCIFSLDYTTYEDFRIFMPHLKDQYVADENVIGLEKKYAFKCEDGVDMKSAHDEFKKLLGANGYIAATTELPYADDDFLTLYSILKTHVRPEKRLYNAFYFGCNSNQHHLATHMFLKNKQAGNIPYKAYGADVKGLSKIVFGDAKDIRITQGFDRTGDLLSLGTLKSINNELDAILVGDIWLYVSDINPKSKQHLYNQLVLAMRVESNGLIVLRMPNNWDIHVYIFVLFCIELFLDVELFKAPWNGKIYLVCKSKPSAKYYAEYLKYIQRHINEQMLGNAFLLEHEYVIQDIKAGLEKLTAERHTQENSTCDEILEWFTE